LDVSDRSGVIQVFCTGEQLGDIRSQDVVRITGKVAQRPEKLVNANLPTGKVELQSEKVEVLSKAHELPFDLSNKVLDLQLPTLLDNRSLTLRHPRVKAIFEVQAAIIESSGLTNAKELDFTTLLLAQIGQPFPLLLSCTLASHSWSFFFVQIHQTFLSEPGVTSTGVKCPFLVGCHSAAKSGFSLSRLFAFEARLPEQ
jgi:hypothetical protein